MYGYYPEGFICDRESLLERFGFIVTGDVLRKYVGSGGIVTIAQTINELGPSCFEDHKTITRIIIPEGVTKIGANAFKGCSNLRSVVIPKSVRLIARSAFENCGFLETVSIPKSIKKIGDCAFRGCVELAEDDFVVVNGVLFDYFGHEENVVIPDGVVEISVHAFANNADIKSVSIPDSVKKIGAGAFCGCENLADENGFVVVENVLYECCNRAETIVIPEGVTEISIFVAKYSSDVVSVKIPTTLTKINKFAFQKSRNLRYIIFPDEFDNDVFSRLWGSCTDVDVRVCMVRGLLKYHLEAIKNSPLWKRRIMAMRDTLVYVAQWYGDAELLGAFFSLYPRGYDLGEVDYLIERCNNNHEFKAFLLNYKNSAYTIGYIEKNANHRQEKELGLRNRTVSEWRRIFNFHHEDGGVTITRFLTSPRALVIPDRIGRRPVKCIAADGFDGRCNTTTVIVPASVEKILRTSFRDNVNLQDVFFANANTEIELWAFTTRTRVTFHAPAGGKVERYAAIMGIGFEAE